MTEAPNTVSGLLRKRKEVTAEIEASKVRLRQLSIDLDHLDATIRLFRPGIELEGMKPARPKPEHPLPTGGLSRVILAELRSAKEPMTSRALTMRFMENHSLDIEDRQTLSAYQSRVTTALRYWRNRDVLRSTQGQDAFLLWEMVR